MKTDTLLLLGAVGIAAYFLMRKPARKGQVDYLKAWVIANSPQGVAAFEYKINIMTNDELSAVYDYIHDYVTKNRDLVEGSDLYNRLMIVSNKYEIFT